jgi:hypothetical protein
MEFTEIDVLPGRRDRALAAKWNEALLRAWMEQSGYAVQESLAEGNYLLVPT